MGLVSCPDARVPVETMNYIFAKAAGTPRGLPSRNAKIHQRKTSARKAMQP